jgi:hypothetical protein
MDVASSTRRHITVYRGLYKKKTKKYTTLRETVSVLTSYSSQAILAYSLCVDHKNINTRKHKSSVVAAPVHIA